MTLDPATRARRSAAAMWESDRASAWFGMRIVAVSEGQATLALTVARDQCNGHGICHGGVIFALADSAFAFACNSRNARAVAQHNTITYLAPAAAGDELIAEAQEIALSGRTGLYDVRVRRADGTAIAAFRGASRLIAGQHFDESGEETE